MLRRRMPILAAMGLLFVVDWLSAEPAWYDPVDGPKSLAIKVLDKGAEPRRPVRWHHVKGQRETGSVSVEDVSDSAKHGRQQRRAASRVAASAQEVSAQETRCHLVFDKFEWSAEKLLSASEEDLSSWAESSIEFTLTSQGLVKNYDVKRAKSAANEVALSVALVDLGAMRPPPFPKEPLGVGARWEVKGKPHSVWTLDETTVCTLTAMDGDRIKIDLSLTRSAKPQKWRPLSDSTAIQLLSYSATGTGTFELDLTSVIPITGIASVVADERKEMRLGATGYAFQINTKHEWKAQIAGSKEIVETPR